MTHIHGPALIPKEGSVDPELARLVVEAVALGFTALILVVLALVLF
jgi:hypothetical protein